MFLYLKRFIKMVNIPIYKNSGLVNLYIPLLIVNGDGTIVDSNYKACEIMGLDKITEDLLLDCRENISFFVSFLKVIIDNRESNQIYFSPCFLKAESSEKFKGIYFIFSYLKDDLCIAEIKKIDVNNEIEKHYTHRISNEKALNKSLSVLMKIDKNSVNKALEYVRETSDASLVYIFKNYTEYKTDDLCAEYSNEVCAPGITPEINNPKYQSFKYKDGLLNIQRKLSNGEIITGYLNNFSPEESKFMSPKNSGYIIIAPIFIDNKWFGFVGMNFCSINKDISVLDIKAIATLSNQLSSYYSLSIKRQIIRDSNYELSDDLVLKDKLTSSMGKDVKNRLHEIIKLSKSLILNVKNNSPETLIENSRLINNSAKTINSVVEYLSELIEYIYSNKNYALKSVSAKAIIGQSISFYKELSSLNSIVLKDESEKDFYLYTDEHIVLAILKSILINAIKYSTQGSVINLLCNRDPEIKGNVVICIKNFGIGLSDDIVKRLYKPVHDISENIERDVTTRLGMQVSKKLIKLIKGEIKIESTEGKGTSVFISIPEVKINDRTGDTNKRESEELTGQIGHIDNELTAGDNVFDNLQHNSLSEPINIKNINIENINIHKINIPLLVISSDGFVIDKNDKACEILGLEDISFDFLLYQREISNVTIAIMKAVVEDKAYSRISFLSSSFEKESLKSFNQIYFVSSFLEKNLCLVHIKKINNNNVIELECLRRIVHEDALNKSASILSEKKKDSPSRAMKYMIEAFNASHIYVYENVTDKKGDLIAKCDEDFCVKGISKKADNCKLKVIDYKKESLIKMQQQLSEGRIISGCINDFFRTEKIASLKSGYLLVVPVFVDSEWFGFIVLEFNYENINISALDLQSLQSVSEQFSVYYSFLKFDQSLLDTKDKLIKNLEFKNKMTSLMRHDIKNPLSGIIGFSDLLIEEINKSSKKDIMEYSTLINNTANSLDKIVDNILEWVKSLNPNVKPDMKKISIKKIVKRSISLVEVMVSFKSVILLNEVNSNCLVYTDEDMLFTVLRNILINAVKFTPEKGTVKIFSENDPKIKDNVLICVEDSGIGMSQERINNILEDTDIISEEGTNGEKGLGLGLQFSKRFIKLVKGEIRIESKINEGAKFIISLPKFKDLKKIKSTD